MLYKTDYALNECVYLITDKRQDQKLITQIKIIPAKDGKHSELYFLVCGDESNWFYSIEFSREKDITKTL